MKFTALRDAVAKQLGWRKVHVSKLAVCRRALLSGGLALGFGAAADAQFLTIPDQGFEDFAHTAAASYSYGSVPGTSGNASGFSPESSGGTGSAWTDIQKDGAERGTAGGDASFLYTADYSVGGQADPIDNQAIEIQGMVAQVLTDTFIADKNYRIIVAAAPSVNTDLRAILFNGTTYADLTAAGSVTAAGILADSSTLSLVQTSTAPSGGVMEDLTFELAVTAGSPLVGQSIGLAFDGNGIGSGIGIDNVRVELFDGPLFDDFLSISIDRDTGAITMSNGTDGSRMVNGYSIRSSNGTLAEANATFLADGDVDWVQLTAPNATSDLSEGHLNTDTFAQGLVHSFGNNTWTQYFDESDITFEYLDENNVLQEGTVEFTGNGDQAFVEGDLNFDGDVNGLDWLQYVSNLGNTFAPQTIVEAYVDGDFDNDGDNDHADFVAFQALYDAANTPGAFAALLEGSSVPEPSSVILLVCAGLGIASVRSRAFSK